MSLRPRSPAIPLLAALLCAVVGAARAQAPPPRLGPAARLPPGAFAGGVPAEGAPGETLRLTLADAIARGLDHNLGPLLAGEDVRRARATRAATLGALLPRAYAAVTETSRQLNFEVFGFSFENAPSVVGPFGIFDARLDLQWALFDPAALARSKSGAAQLDAAERSYDDARELVVVSVADQYLQMLAAERLVASVAAQVDTSETLRRIALDRKAAGSAAGIEVLRAEVRLQQDRQRLIATRNAQIKQRLDVARMIGLPLGQELEPAESMSEAAPAVPTVEVAVAQAWASRRDLAAAQARLDAARASRQAAARDRLPAVRFHGNYGLLGLQPSNAKETFDLGASVAVPIYDRATIDSEAIRAEAELRSRQAELEDLHAAIYYEVRGTLLDLDAAREEVEVGRSGLDLARRQLEQARNRFAAGVASNLEVVEAQESLARADETFIASLYRLTLERLQLGRAVGATSDALAGLVAGAP